jgi:hypothetical protein
MTLPGGAVVLVTPSIVAALGVIAAAAIPGDTVSAAAHATAATTAAWTRPELRRAARCTGLTLPTRRVSRHHPDRVTTDVP